MRRFHQLLGLALACLFAYVIWHKSRYLPNLAVAPAFAGSGKAGRGYFVALGLPLAAIVCFIWPERLMWWLSPRTPPDYEYLLTEGAWYILGYALLIVGIGVLLVFR